MKKMILTTALMAVTCSTFASDFINLDVAGPRFGFQTVNSELEFSGNNIQDTTVKGDMDGVEVGFDFNRVFGTTFSYSKGDDNGSDYDDIRAAGEFGYTFFFDDEKEFSIKPYGSIGWEKANIKDNSQFSFDASMSGLTAGIGARATIFKYGYVGVEYTALTGKIIGIDTTLTNARVSVGGRVTF
ncbi:outer membrane beta-barrel protein [Vibrio sp. TRT 2004]|uniref:outer membrane beta-barrel protein n=1 Tax=Vibrio sp. TRT 2004 TaxID=3418506 RepID=UPI003CF35ECB